MASLAPWKPRIEITPELLDKVEWAAAQGMSQGDTAIYIGMSQATFIDKKKIYPELFERYEKGRVQGLLDATKVLKENITERKDQKAVQYFLDRRGGEAWRPEPSVVVSNTVVIPLFEAKEQKLIEVMYDTVGNQATQATRSIGPSGTDEEGRLDVGADTPTVTGSRDEGNAD